MINILTTSTATNGYSVILASNRDSVIAINTSIHDSNRMIRISNIIHSHISSNSTINNIESCWIWCIIIFFCFVECYIGFVTFTNRQSNSSYSFWSFSFIEGYTVRSAVDVYFISSRSTCIYNCNRCCRISNILNINQYVYIDFIDFNSNNIAFTWSIISTAQIACS